MTDNKTRSRNAGAPEFCEPPRRNHGANLLEFASGAHDPEKCTCGFRTRSCANKKGKRSAERRIVKPMSASSAACALLPRLSLPPCGGGSGRGVNARRLSAPTLAALATGSTRWLSSRTGFPAALANGSFARFAQTMPRLSTLRADRSSCRSTGDPKPPGCGSFEDRSLLPL